MFRLDFEFYIPVSGPGGPYPDLWVDECQLGSFEGFQRINVNGKDFSSPLPILGFARALKVIAFDLQQNKGDTRYYHDLSSPWKLQFRRTGFDIEISDERGCESIPFQEFLDTVQRYSEMVYAHCCDICPELQKNEFVQEWWINNEYFTTVFEPKNTDCSTLTPHHPFFKKPPS